MSHLASPTKSLAWSVPLCSMPEGGGFRYSSGYPSEQPCLQRKRRSVTSHHYHIVPGSRPPRQNRQSARAGRLDLLLTPRGSPPTRLQSTCVRPGELLWAPSRVTVLRSLEAPLPGRGGESVWGAGRGERGRSREQPSGVESSRAEPSRAARCRGEAGRACRRLRTHRAVFPGSVSPCLCPGTGKTFIVSGTPPGCVTKSQRSAVSSPKLACSGDRGNVQPSPPGSCALRFLTCRSLPGTVRGDP